MRTGRGANGTSRLALRRGDRKPSICRKRSICQVQATKPDETSRVCITDTYIYVSQVIGDHAPECLGHTGGSVSVTRMMMAGVGGVDKDGGNDGGRWRHW